MIITKLQGGLGNQMFQYALGRYLSLKNKTALKLDTSWFDKKKRFTKRNYNLEVFNILESFASADEIKQFKKYKKGKGLRNIFHNFFATNKLIYIEEKREYCFDEKILCLPKNIYLNGYWQNEKYFKDIEEIILKEFTLKNKLSENAQNTENKIVNSESVSIHIRRGDYVSNKNFNKQFGVCSINYYNKAIEVIRQKTSRPHFFIFSDDIEWCRKNLKIDSPTTFVENNKDFEELILMSKCKHNIIANSSFSWWGAWLNSNKDKIVITPKKWCKNKNTKDLIPKSWTQI